MNKLSKFFKHNDLQFFTIDELENERISSGILVLDSGYFNIFLITLDRSIDDRERALDIEEHLERCLEDYSHFNYLEKEMILYEDEHIEKVLIVLLKRDIVDER